MRQGRFAAIDIGTVTCRLLVADVDEAGLHQLAKGYRITNLGEDVDATGVLKEEAMQRVCDAVAGFQGQIASLSSADLPVEVVAVATSASRDAKNAQVFQDKMAAMGITLSVIPGQREAALTFRGACSGFEGQQVMVVDIGGGSTEVVAGLAGEEPARSHSFNIGCRRVTERFFHHDPPAPEEVEQARGWIAQQMRGYFDELRAEGLLPARMIAVAGTATSVVSVHLAMEEYDSERVQGFQVSREVLDQVYQRLIGTDLAGRQRIVGLDPGRAPVIVAGMVILQSVLDLAQLDGYTVSESDILQGIILSQ